MIFFKYLASILQRSSLNGCFHKDSEKRQQFYSFFFYLGFLSRKFTNHRTAGEGGGHFFNSSPPLPPASQTLTRRLRHIASRQTQPGNLWFPSASCQPLSYACGFYCSYVEISLNAL